MALPSIFASLPMPTGAYASHALGMQGSVNGFCFASIAAALQQLHACEYICCMGHVQHMPSCRTPPIEAAPCLCQACCGLQQQQLLQLLLLLKGLLAPSEVELPTQHRCQSGLQLPSLQLPAQLPGSDSPVPTLKIDQAR